MSDPFLKDTFADEWRRFCDADPTNDPDFTDKARSAGLIDLVSVTKDALSDPFAAERGIVPGGQMYVLTPAGRKRFGAAEKQS